MEIIPEFEYDSEKSKANFAKHGIDFDEAKALWLDDDAVELDVEYPLESRFAVIGLI